MIQSTFMRRSRAAFTLLEMLLTLAMCVVLMTLVSGAISFYVREMASAEQVYRNSQVASAVLQMIEDDLRMTLTTRPIDTAPLAEVLSSASSPLSALGISSGAAGGDEDSVPEDSGLSGSGADASDEEAADAETFDASLGGSVLMSPGLIGSSNQLQIDVSHLPTLEDSVIDPAMAISNGKLLDRPSDIKTVSYFVQPAGAVGSMDPLEELATSSGMASTTTAAGPTAGGLVRRELDRAITSHASSTGGLARLTSAGEIISTEVTAIQFEYYENGNWMTYYNTDSVGFLPPAIRVTIQIGGGSAFSTGDAAAVQSVNTYTHVIYLPMSHPEDAEELTDTSTDSASGGSGV
ncbi:PulJ/GspJ family protein [Allorhodopirellula heiligendammensis]|uniref:Pseudopilin GspJ n=1 Tax=Allorhodopirellula heiligendammensis TaxID=2714739 RepID=A0A5C6C6R4_9BACT|nr:type II secretion system protein [Allorhodopirellula heiligendammensis]TWU19772.1 hypothetical protein Poly21_19500 [Allorhodopirellula heiligendammensis]